MNNNLYRPSTSSVTIEGENVYELATKSKRLLASTLDAVISAPLNLATFYLLADYGKIINIPGLSLGYTFVAILSALFVFLLINGKFLIDNGQTIGKKIVGI